MTSKHRILLTLFLAIYLIFLLLNSWASDDAFITLRVVRNFFHGYGLRWNGAERVQVFTHPLWLVVLTPFYAITRNPFSTLFIACYIFSTITVYILLFKISPSLWASLIVSAALLTSKSFMDYSSSGLENPLSHFLIILFAYIFLYRKQNTKKDILLLTLLFSLSLFNRLDTFLFYLPPYVVILWQLRKQIRNFIGIVVLGFLPIIIWEIFSLLYYGFPFPNTFYAKLTTGIPQNELIKQGWFYFYNSLTWDHITLPLILIAIILSVIQQEKKRISLALGLVLYLLYVLRMGGDFMSGRFFSTPFILSLGLILSLPLLRKIKINMYSSLAASILILFVGFTSYEPPLLIQSTDHDGIVDEFGIADEKLIYFRCCSLLSLWHGDSHIKIADDARKAEEEGVSLVIRESIGIYGFYTGPDVYIMDKVCLSDPLRARLPVTGPWRIGHFYRHYPEGYPESIEKDFVNQIREPHLHEFYDKLMLVTRGNLLSFERLQAIVMFNLGFFDHLVDEYMHSTDWENQ